MVRQCGTNSLDYRMLLIKLAIELQTGGRAPLDSGLLEPAGGLGEEAVAVQCPVRAALFVLDDVPAEQPVARHQIRVDGAGARAPGLLVGPPAQVDEMPEVECPAHGENPICLKRPPTFLPNASISNIAYDWLSPCLYMMKASVGTPNRFDSFATWRMSSSLLPLSTSDTTLRVPISGRSSSFSPF